MPAGKGLSSPFAISLGDKTLAHLNVSEWEGASLFCCPGHTNTHKEKDLLWCPLHSPPWSISQPSAKDPGKVLNTQQKEKKKGGRNTYVLWYIHTYEYSVWYYMLCVHH